MDRQCGTIFREYRKRKGYRVVDIQKILRDEYGFSVSIQSIYAWESNTSCPPLPVFIMLCELYDIRDLATFMKSPPKTDDIMLTDEDKELVRRYHANKRARKAVQEILDIPPQLRSV